jgi:SAM-dependent methyltransferase
MRKRERFLSKLAEDIRPAYEVEAESYAEDAIGELEYQAEGAYFQDMVDRTGSAAVVPDLACGDGRHTFRLAERVGGVVGLDFSHYSLAKAKQKCLARGNATLVGGSVFQLPFRPSAFDAIWMSQAFEYVPPDMRRTFLTSLYDVLKDSGILYMSVNTWQSPSIITSFKRLWTDFKLFCYWKLVKRKPLLWGEYYEFESVKRTGWSGWHYHVHTSKRTLSKLLDDCRFSREETVLYDEYVYVLCRKTSGSA